MCFIHTCTKQKKLNNYTVLYKQDTEGSGLGEINFYFTLQLPTGEVYKKAINGNTLRNIESAGHHCTVV